MFSNTNSILSDHLSNPLFSIHRRRGEIIIIPSPLIPPIRRSSEIPLESIERKKKALVSEMKSLEFQSTQHSSRYKF